MLTLVHMVGLCFVLDSVLQGYMLIGEQCVPTLQRDACVGFTWQEWIPTLLQSSLLSGYRSHFCTYNTTHVWRAPGPAACLYTYRPRCLDYQVAPERTQSFADSAQTCHGLLLSVDALQPSSWFRSVFHAPPFLHELHLSQRLWQWQRLLVVLYVVSQALRKCWGRRSQRRSATPPTPPANVAGSRRPSVSDEILMPPPATPTSSPQSSKRRVRFNRDRRDSEIIREESLFR